MKHCIYILTPDSGENWLYVGYTINPEERLKKHNGGKVISTKQRRPYRMVVVERYATKDEATKRERQIKKSTATKKRLVKKSLENEN